MDEKQAKSLKRAVNKLNKADEALRTDKETPIKELATNWLKARAALQKLASKIEESA